MAHAPATIIAIKQDFLSTQTRLLSRPSAPSAAWRSSSSASSSSLEAGARRRQNRAVAAADDHDHDNDSQQQQQQQQANEPRPLPEKAVDDALFRLNHRLQQHARRVFPPQATRHVAEQIDKLYQDLVERRVAGGGDDEDLTMDADGAEGLLKGADLTNPSAIATLPASWDAWAPPRAVAAHPLGAARYADLAGRLQDLAARRQDAAARVARLRRVRALLDPFDGGGGGDGREENEYREAEGQGGVVANVQPNLVTREGEIETQLERMRMLLARVGGRVAALKEREGGGGGGGQGSPSPTAEGTGRGRGGGLEAAARDSAGADDHHRPDAMIVDDLEADERRKVGDLLDML